MTSEYKFWVRNKTNDGWVNILKDSQIEIDPNGQSSGQFAGDTLDAVLFEIKLLIGNGSEPGYAGTPVHIINTDDVSSSVDVGGSFSTAGGMAVAKSLYVGSIFDVSGNILSGGDIVVVGNVSGVDGTFTGNMSGVDGTFTGNMSGVDGTFTGNVSGVDGTFAGNVSGVDGTFAGDLVGNTLDVLTYVNNNLIPMVDGIQFLGTPTKKWHTIFVDTVSAGIVDSGNFTGVFTGNMVGNLTGDVAGDVVGNLSGDLIKSPTVTVTSNQGSTSGDTGALVVEGGIGVSENVFIDGDLVVGGTITGGAISYDPVWGAIPESIIPSGNGLYDIGSMSNKWRNLYLSETLNSNVTGNVVGDLDGNLTKTNVMVTSTSGSIGPDSGSLVVAGGVGIAENLYVGGDFYVDGLINFPGGLSGDFTGNFTGNFTGDLNGDLIKGSTVHITNPTPALSYGEGSLVIAGGTQGPNGAGLTVEGNTFIGGDLSLSGDIVSTSTPSFDDTLTLVDSFDLTVYRGMKYIIAFEDLTNSQYYMSEIIIMHDGITPYITEYGVISTVTVDPVFSVAINGFNVELRVDADIINNTNNVVSYQRTTIKVP